MRPRADLDALLDHVATLSQKFPHRHSGEPDERAAAEYIGEQLRTFGLQVEISEVPIMGWGVVEPASLEIIAPERLTLACVPLIFSGSTPPSGLTGTCVYLGPTVVASGFVWERFSLVDDEGLTCAIIVGRPDGPPIAQAGPPAGAAGMSDNPAYTWPACTVGEEALTVLRHFLGTGEVVRLRYRALNRYTPDARSTIVCGKLRGSTCPEEIVLAGAHHDTQGALGFPADVDSPGANDNASGVAILLELARHYGAAAFSRSLWFCSFGSEERNLLMSREYCRGLLDTGVLDSVIAYLGVDQAAKGDSFRLLASSVEPHIAPKIDMRAILGEAAEALDLHTRFPTHGPAPLHAASDHWPFYVAGVPTFLTGWHPFSTYHRGGDTLAYCDAPDQFSATFDIMAEMCERIGQLDPVGKVKRSIWRAQIGTEVSV